MSTEPCPSCERDLSYPGAPGHKCYTAADRARAVADQTDLPFDCCAHCGCADDRIGHDDTCRECQTPDGRPVTDQIVRDTVAVTLYDHREGALTCHDHPPTPDQPWWCCVCGEHRVRVSWRAHLADVLAPLLAQARAEAVAAALAPVERLAERWQQDYPSLVVGSSIRAAVAEGKEAGRG